MFTSISYGKYIYRNSIIHNLNPMVKIIITLLILFSILINNIYQNMFLSLLIIVYIILSKINFRLYLKNILNIKIFLIMIFIINFLFNASIILSLNIIIKIVLIILETLILMYTTTIKELTYGLNKLLRPLQNIKINPNKITLIITYSIRFIPLVIENANETIESLESRGIIYKKESIKNKIKILKLIILPIFVNSMNKADIISDIMDLRLYNIDVKRNSYRIKEARIKDYIFLLINVIFLIIMRW